MKPIHPSYRFFAFSMAVLMFVTSVGFVLDLHYCQGQLKSASLFGKAKNCHEMAAVQSTCSHHKQMAEPSSACAMEQKDCCQNKMVRVQSDQDQKLISSDLVVNQPLQHFLLAYVSTFLLEQQVAIDQPKFEHYEPPLISRDIYVLTQSFLL